VWLEYFLLNYLRRERGVGSSSGIDLVGLGEASSRKKGIIEGENGLARCLVETGHRLTLTQVVAASTFVRCCQATSCGQGSTWGHGIFFGLARPKPRLGTMGESVALSGVPNGHLERSIGPVIGDALTCTVVQS
jgi:hypothetical protein